MGALWTILRGNSLEALTAIALVALLAACGWLWVDAQRWELEAGARANLIEAMRTAAVGQNERYRNLEEGARHAMQTILERDRAALADRDARIERLRQQARAGGSGVPTVPGIDGSLEACQQRVAEIGRRTDGVDQVAERVRSEAGNCAGDVATLNTCQAELRVCSSLR